MMKRWTWAIGLLLSAALTAGCTDDLLDLVLAPALEALETSAAGESGAQITAPQTAPSPAPSGLKPTATPAPSIDTADPMVGQVLELVNAERAKVGAKALTLSAAINEVARFRSQDMGDRDYFAHIDPDGHDPFYWLKKYGVPYRTAGENIASGQRTPTEVMTAWMNSTGHKANILDVSFGKIGIGIVKNSAGRLYWTQMFTD